MSIKVKFAIGDKVAYSAQFLRSISEYTGAMPAARGIVVGACDMGKNQIVTIDWNNDCPRKVLSSNLAHVGPNSRFCNC